MKTFVTLFPNYQDFHFYKDPGQIPFRMQRFGYNSKIVSYNNSANYNITNKNIQIDFIDYNTNNRRSNFLILKYLYSNSKKIDVLNIFHVDWGSLLYAFAYKFFNKNGIVYLKMDNCCYTGEYIWEKQLNNPFYDLNPIQTFKRLLLANFFIKKVDFFSVEDEDSLLKYSKLKGIENKIFCSYNGYTNDLFIKDEEVSLTSKKNIILTVGRLGSDQKATDVILEGYSKFFSVNKNWELHLVGDIQKDFQQYIQSFFKTYPELQTKIVFHGWLDKIELFKLYRISKLFILPSKYEGFANVFSEAMFFKNVIITTKYVSPKQIIHKYCGIIIDEPNANQLANALNEISNNTSLLKLYAENGYKFAVKFLNWDKIVSEINYHINQKK
jgi:glycosyltransferase involved in cell wall biosynthesis